MRFAGARLAGAVVAAALLLGGCGEADDAPLDRETAKAPPASSARQAASFHGFGAYSGDSSLGVEQVVRAYVDALSTRDGHRFCRLVAAYISGRYDVTARELARDGERPRNCPDLVGAFIGYSEEAYQPMFLRAAVKEIGRPVGVGGLMRVTLKLSVDWSEQEDPPPRARRLPDGRFLRRRGLRDVVWLARSGGAWRVARLSAVAAAASILVDGRPNDDHAARPDVAGEQRRFEAAVLDFERRTRSIERSFRSPGRLADCSGGVTLRDAARDLRDYQFPAPRTPIPRTPGVDLRGLQVRSKDEIVCVRVDMAGNVARPLELSFTLADWANAGQGFHQSFVVKLRKGGDVHVTSGEDEDRRPVVIPARVGIEGARLSLVLDRQSFERGSPGAASNGTAPLSRFVFQVSATAQLSERRTLYDAFEGGPRGSRETRFGYPGGRMCETGRGCW